MDAEATYRCVVDELGAKTGEVEHAKMFGMPSVKAAGKAIGGFYEGAMVFKLPALLETSLTLRAG